MKKILLILLIRKRSINEQARFITSPERGILKVFKNPGIPTKIYPSLELVRLEKMFFDNKTKNKNLLEYGIAMALIPNTF